MRHTGVSDIVAFCFSAETEEIPTLRLAPWRDLFEAVNCSKGVFATILVNTV